MGQNVTRPLQMFNAFVSHMRVIWRSGRAVHAQPKRIARLSVVLTISLLLSSFVPAYAQPAVDAQRTQTATPTWRTAEQTDGVSLQWDAWGGQPSVAAAAVDAAAQQRLAAQLPTMRYGGYNLPMQLTSVLLPDGVDATPQIQQLEDGAWSAGLVEAAPLSLDGFDVEDEYFAPVEEKMLPAAPVFVLREGRMRGQRIAVIAFSPIYAQAGAIKFAYRMAAVAPNAKPLTNLAQFADQNVAQASAAPRVGGVAPSPPTNAAALQNSIKVKVAAAGLQTIAGSALIDNGIAANTTLATLQLFYGGAEVALQVQDSDGKLDASTQVHFYAHHQIDSLTVGDWWNETEIYWLTYKAGANGLRMGSRAATPGTAALRANAIEKGIWEDNQIYESTMPGVDNDHWFAAELNADPTQAGNPSLYPKAAVTLNNVLPLDATSGDPSIFRLTGSARTNLVTHTLEVNVGGAIQTLA